MKIHRQFDSFYLFYGLVKEKGQRSTMKNLMYMHRSMLIPTTYHYQVTIINKIRHKSKFHNLHRSLTLCQNNWGQYHPEMSFEKKKETFRQELFWRSYYLHAAMCFLSDYQPSLSSHFLPHLLRTFWPSPAYLIITLSKINQNRNWFKLER